MPGVYRSSSVRRLPGGPLLANAAAMAKVDWGGSRRGAMMLAARVRELPRGRKKMHTRFGGLIKAAACVGVLLSVGNASGAEAPTWSITLTGQSMIRSDIRQHVPAAVPVIK